MLTRLKRLAMTAVDAINAAGTEMGATAVAPPNVYTSASKLHRAADIAKEYCEMIQRETEVNHVEIIAEVTRMVIIAERISNGVLALTNACPFPLIGELNSCTALERVDDFRNVASGRKQVRETQLGVAKAAEMVACCASSLDIEAHVAAELLRIATEAEKIVKVLGYGLTGIAAGSF
ncbi:hypothetical protein BGZ58_002835 [Dissophora ornata]|nr:hypothetical protein BGZ58_002835 [Dissophora ornata]